MLLSYRLIVYWFSCFEISSYFTFVSSLKVMPENPLFLNNCFVFSNKVEEGVLKLEKYLG